MKQHILFQAGQQPLGSARERSRLGRLRFTKRKEKHRMHHKSTVVAAFVAASSIVSNGRADMVTDWNVNLEKAVRVAGVPPFFQPRFAAIVHTAIYDAVNGIVRQYTPYFVTDPSPPGARPEAAAAEAAATALKGLFPAQAAAIDAEFADSLATIPG